jgi:hypothetical protein
MELCHNDTFLNSPAMQRLAGFIRQSRMVKNMEGRDFERFESELHTLVMAVECELVGEELARYNVEAEEIEVAGQVYRYTLTSSETYLSAAGSVTVTRHLYRPPERGSRSICPLELRAGIISGYFTPRAARQAAFVMAHLTPGESEALFDELGAMRPSRSSLDRLPKALSKHWEVGRTEKEAKLREQETVPCTAVVMALSVDGVMAPLKGADLSDKREQAGKHASGPTGYKEVGCGTVVLYGDETERLQTIRYARMPEHKKVTLQRQIEAEAASILAVRPDLLRIHLADGTKDNWRLLDEIESHLPPPAQPPIEIVDFYHACDHLKNGCDAAWGESTAQSKAQFERLKTLLKETNDGAERVIRALRYRRDRASGNKRKRLEAELTYFRNQRHRMHYAEYLHQGFPIASGVMEASCKTLVTQRLKHSGMAWTMPGGQAILTLRSLIQSDRWQSAWELLRANFHQDVKVRIVTKESKTLSAIHWLLPGSLGQPNQKLGYIQYAALPLAA